MRPTVVFTASWPFKAQGKLMSSMFDKSGSCIASFECPLCDSSSRHLVGWKSWRFQLEGTSHNAASHLDVAACGFMLLRLADKTVRGQAFNPCNTRKRPNLSVVQGWVANWSSIPGDLGDSLSFCNSSSGHLMNIASSPRKW